MTPNAAHKPTIAPRTVLIVDDCPSVRHYHSFILEKNGFKCSTADNGREALVLLQKQPVDLLIADLVMPDMTGDELICSLRKSGTLAQLPVLIISSERRGERLCCPRTAAAGPVRFVQKPLLPATILAAIEGLLQ